MLDSTFHSGETAAQIRAGVREKAEKLGARLVNHTLPGQHRTFFRSLPLLFVGSIDQRGRPWASVLAGNPGFAHSPTPNRLVVQAAPSIFDPLSEHLGEGSPLGMLGLEFITRRRNRVNGRVVRAKKGEFELQVEQSFGNCPAYIQKRELKPRSLPAVELVKGESLDAEAESLINRSDTFFIASYFDEQGVDMSHRGGKPGFVKIEGNKKLVFPDFSGNNLLNTIGNLVAQPQAGLLFLNFDSGDLLQIVGSATIVWEGAEVEAFEGAKRLVKLEIEQWRLLRHALPFSWTLEEFSPALKRTGSWAGTQ